MFALKRSILYATLLALIPGVAAAGPIRSKQEPEWTVGVPWQGPAAKVETVAQIIERERLYPKLLPKAEEEEPSVNRFGLPEDPESPAVSQWPPAQRLAPTTATPSPFSPGISWNALNETQSGNFFPPDNMMAVGPTQVLVNVNSQLRLFSKTGVAQSFNVSSSNFFASLTNVAVSDPEVRFDPLTNRWFVVAIDFVPNNLAPNQVLIAVSSGPTITNGTSFSLFAFKPENVGATPNADTGLLGDRPALAVDKNALYVGLNMFNPKTGNLANTSLYVVRKSSILGAGPIVVTPFRSLINNQGQGMFMPCPADNADPFATVGHVVAVNNGTLGQLLLRTVANPGGTPSISSDFVLTVPTTAQSLTPAPTKGGSNDTDDDRIWNARIELNRLTGKRTLWCAHNIATDATGAGNAKGDRNSIRWYNIDVSGTSPTLIQSGTMFDSSATNPRFFYFPGIAMNGQGHMFLGSSVSSSAEFSDIAGSGRFANDALGSTRPVSTLYATKFSYLGGRWGDYTYACIDPSDGMTVWTVQETVDAVDDWVSRVIQMLAPPPATISSISPTSFAIGTSGTITVTGSALNGSGFFDAGVGYSKHLGASAGQGGITVNSVTYVSPVSAKVNITVGQTSQRFHDLTIVNPDGQRSTLPGAIAVTNGAGPFVNSINFNPGTVLVGQKCTTSVTLSGAAPSGGATVALTSSNSSLASVPASVSVGAGTLTSPSFTITAGSVSGITTVTLSATLNGLTTNGTLTIRPSSAGILLPQSSVIGGTILAGVTVALDQATPTAISVRLTSDNAAAALPPFASIAAGASFSPPFLVSTAVVSSTTVANLSSTVNGIKKTVALTVNPATVSAINLSASSVVGGGTVKATVKLNGKAPAGGDAITLTYSNPSLISAAASATVPAGGLSSNTVSIFNFGVAADTTLKVTAKLGTASVSASYLIKAATPLSLVTAASSVAGGSQVGITLNLTGQAPPNGLSVAVTSSNTTVAESTTITVFNENISGTGIVNTNSVAASTSVTLKATVAGVSKSTILTVTPATLSSLTCQDLTPAGGTTETGFAILTGTTKTGLTVGLKSSDSSLASVPASVNVAAGQSQGSFNITTTGVSTATAVTITGTSGAVTKTMQLQIQPPSLANLLWFGNQTITSGQSVQGAVTLNGVAPSAGMSIPLGNSNPSALSAPASVVFPGGASQSNDFTVVAKTVTSSTTSTLSVTLGNTTDSITITVNPAGLLALDWSANALCVVAHSQDSEKPTGADPLCSLIWAYETLYSRIGEAAETNLDRYGKPVRANM